MTEITAPPYASVDAAARAAGRGRIEAWLWSVAALLFALVMLGGATRLTESGLSITEWEPVKGVIPPLTHVAWLEAFARYKQIPQAELYPDMTLGHFQAIFLMEWTHRLVARLLEVALLVPLVVFAVCGMLTWRLAAQVLGVIVLIGLQGVVGWWMVASGLVDRVEVAQEFLAAHLLLASITFTCLVWLATAQRPAREARAPRALRALAGVVILVVLAQIGLGALVAGTRAGKVYNTWPLMGGQLIPSEMLGAMSPWWRNFVDNVAEVQFQHRMTAYALLALALIQAAWTARALPATAAMRRALVVAGLVLAQATIGIVTLLLVVPLWAGLLHQSFAMLVLGMAVVHRQRLGGKVRASDVSFSRLREKVAPQSGVG